MSRSRSQGRRGLIRLPLTHQSPAPSTRRTAFSPLASRADIGGPTSWDTFPRGGNIPRQAVDGSIGAGEILLHPTPWGMFRTNESQALSNLDSDRIFPAGTPSSAESSSVAEERGGAQLGEVGRARGTEGQKGTRRWDFEFAWACGSPIDMKICAIAIFQQLTDRAASTIRLRSYARCSFWRTVSTMRPINP